MYIKLNEQFPCHFWMKIMLLIVDKDQRYENGNETLPNTAANSQATTFTWSEHEQGLVLGSYFWGYFLTQVIFIS